MRPVLDTALICEHVAAALAEDIGAGDATTEALIDASARGCADLIAREPLMVAGIPLAIEAFRQLDLRSEITVHVEEGHFAQTGTSIATVKTSLRALLTAERTALNYLQRLSGVATQAARFVQAVDGTGVKILDTRKTTPGWRVLEKYAVQCGGAANHRRGLDDMIMIKDNHLALRGGAIEEAIAQARQNYPNLRIEVEADTLEQVAQAAGSGVDFILLDNMSADQLREAVELVAGRALTEASGGITMDTIRTVAETGVDAISLGALTHSAPAVDIAMDILQ